jgi:hypothetical protein
LEEFQVKLIVFSELEIILPSTHTELSFGNTRVAFSGSGGDFSLFLHPAAAKKNKIIIKTLNFILLVIIGFNHLNLESAIV